MTAPSREMRSYRKRRVTDRMPCPCWCEAEYVMLTQREVYNGITQSCGRYGCHDPKVKR